MEESPPPFIVFRSPKLERVDLYQVALDFTAKVELVLQKTEARYFLKDRLDRNASAVAMKIAQAVNDRAPSGRRATYRQAHALAADCSTVLDILARRSDIDRSAVLAAQQLLMQLLSNLDHLRNQSV
jgi:hypothetical protein